MLSNLFPEVRSRPTMFQKEMLEKKSVGKNAGTQQVRSQDVVHPSIHPSIHSPLQMLPVCVCDGGVETPSGDSRAAQQLKGLGGGRGTQKGACSKPLYSEEHRVRDGALPPANTRATRSIPVSAPHKCNLPIPRPHTHTHTGPGSTKPPVPSLYRGPRGFFPGVQVSLSHSTKTCGFVGSGRIVPSVCVGGG